VRGKMDSKSIGRKVVWVQLSPRAQIKAVFDNNLSNLKNYDSPNL